jgi:aldose 1-epimerase
MTPIDRPSVRTQEVEGVGTVVLAEPATRSEASVAVALGSNVVGFRTEVFGRPVAVLAPPPSMATLRDQPSRWGCAVLFPYPGRVTGSRFSFAGREVVLPVDPRHGVAMHGFARGRPWRLVDSGADPGDGAWVVTRLDTVADGVRSAEWPFPCALSLRVTLRAGRLRVEPEVLNTGDGPMPMGVGFHPYFPTPLGQLGSPDACQVWVDATEIWERRSETPVVSQLAPDEWLRRPRALGRVPTRPTAQGDSRNVLFRRAGARAGSDRHGVRAGVRDPANGLAVTLEASPEFGAMVLYTPPTPPVVSLEPYSCVPDALNLAAALPGQTGLVVLAPGERWRGWIEIRAHELGPIEGVV